MRDDDAAFSVLEAVISVLIIGAAIFFVTTSAGGFQQEIEGSHDTLASIASDTLINLANEPGARAGGSRLDDAVESALLGDVAGTEAILEQYLPADVWYSMKIHNGVKPMTVMPAPITSIAQRESGSAYQLAVPPWQKTYSGTNHFTPGQEFDLACQANLIEYYVGAWQTAGPNGATWKSTWDEFTPGYVPTNLPFGNWRCGVLPSQEFVVTPLPGAFSEAGPIGVQLQLWWIA